MDLPADKPIRGYVNVTFEIHDGKSVRTHIVRQSYLAADFVIACDSQLTVDLQRMAQEVAREIINPSEKKAML